MKMIRNDNKSSPFGTDKRYYYNDKLKMNNCNNDNHKNTNIDGGSTAALLCLQCLLCFYY